MKNIIVRWTSVLVVASALSACSAIDLLRSEAYRAGADAGSNYADANDFLNVADSWANEFGAENDVTDSTPQERCEFLWNLTGLFTYRLENNDANESDFISGCLSTISGA